MSAKTFPEGLHDCRDSKQDGTKWIFRDKDPRIEVTEAQDLGSTPLWRISLNAKPPE